MKKKLFTLFILLTVTMMMIMSCSQFSAVADDDDDDDNGNNGGSGTSIKLSDCFVQKGPFVQGSNITIQELDDNFSPTGKSYSTSTLDDFGSFSINSTFTSNNIEIIADGYYFNEVTGEISPGPLSLRVVNNITADTNVNINILTTLEKDRISYLVDEDGKSFNEAKVQAEKEILTIFKIPEEIIDSISGFEKMDISKTGDSNAILLAISAILQADNSVGQLSELISKISVDIKEDGELTNTTTISELADNAMNLDLAVIRQNIETRYTNLGLSVSIPNFEDFIDSDGDGIINTYDYELQSPSGLISNTKPLLDWSDSTIPGSTYHVQVASDALFTQIVEEADALTESSYQLTTALDNLTTYYWRVFSVDSESVESNLADSNTFSIDINSVTLTNPTQTTSNTRPTLDWADAVLQNVSYTLQLASNEDFTIIVETASSLTDSNYTTKTILTNNTTYYYRVALVDENTIQGTWSNGSISIDIGTVTPMTNGALNTTLPTLDWSDSTLPGVTYTIEISDSQEFSTTVDTATGLTDSNYTLKKTLNNDATYYYRVALIDENDIQGVWSTDSITIDLGAVTTLTDGTLTNTLPTLDWTDSTLPDVAYTVEISDNQEFTTTIETATDLTDSTYTLKTPLDNAATYYYRVAVIDENDIQGVWSTDSITIDLGAVTTLTDGTLTNTLPTLDWTDSILPDVAYTVEISDNQEFTTTIETATDLTDSTYTLKTPLSNAATYYYRVAVIDENDVQGAWSNGSISIDLGTVTTLTDGTLTNTLPTLDWTDSTLPGVTYTVEISDNLEFTTPVETSTDITDSTYTLKTVLDNTTMYYYRVAVIDENDIQGSWIFDSISIDLGTVTVPISGTVNTSRPTLDWDDSTLPGVTYAVEISDSPNFTTILEAKTALPDSTHQIEAPLNHLDTYYYRVAVIDENAVQGSWANSTFDIDLGTVTLELPATEDRTNDRTPSFSWNANSSALAYTLIISENADLSSPAFSKKVTGNTYTLAGTEQLANTSGTTYYWGVKPVDAYDTEGTLSGIRNFSLKSTMPTATVTINNGDTQTSDETVLISISSSEAGILSEMYISPNSNFDSGDWEAFSATKEVTYADLADTDNATINVYIMVRDIYGNQSNIISDSIDLVRTIKAGGNITTNETWTTAGNPYIIKGNIGVLPGVTLTINAGVVIHYAGDYEMIVKGNLIADGAAGNNIVLTTQDPEAKIARMIIFKGTDLIGSSMSYLTMSNATAAIQIGEETEHNQGDKNTNTLTVSNITLDNAGIKTDGYQTGAKIILNDVDFTNARIQGTYPRSEMIEINGGTITDSEIKSDSYNNGIIIRNTTINNTDFTLGCCGANIEINQCILTNSKFTEGGGSPVGGPVKFIASSLTDVVFYLPSATITMSDCTVNYTEVIDMESMFPYFMYDYPEANFTIGNGTIEYSTFSGAGSETLLHVMGYNGYSNNGAVTISYTDFSSCGIAIKFSDSSGIQTIANSNITANNYAVYNENDGTVSAENNYWGTAVSTDISVKIYDGADDINFSMVDFDPYLTTTQPGTGPR